MLHLITQLLDKRIITLVFCSLLSTGYAQSPKERQIAKQFTSQRYLYGTCDEVTKACKSDVLGYKFDYWEYTPSDYVTNATKKFPLVIFLHGMGEKANGTPTSLNLLLAGGMPKLINANKADYPFITISPQTKWPVDWQPEMVDEMIEVAKKTLRVDTNMIYVTGLSMGGDGTYRYAGNNNYYKKLAAVVPVSAYMSGADACQVANIPVRSFTGKDDWMLTSSVNAVNGINNCNPKPNPLAELKITIGGHNAIAWDTIYSIYNNELWEWMLSKKRNSIVTASEVAEKFLTDITISPNPANDVADIFFNSSEQKQLSVVLVSVLGIQELIIPNYNAEMGINTLKIDLMDKKPGLYALKVISENRIVYLTKLLKVK